MRAASLNVTQMAIQFMSASTTAMALDPFLEDGISLGLSTLGYFPTMTLVALTAKVTASPTLMPICFTEPSVIADTLLNYLPSRRLQPSLGPLVSYHLTLKLISRAQFHNNPPFVLRPTYSTCRIFTFIKPACTPGSARTNEGCLPGTFNILSGSSYGSNAHY